MPGYADEIAAARKAVLTVEGQSLTADLKARGMSLDDFLEDADYAAIEDAYRRASRVLSADVSRTYAEYVAANKSSPESEEERLMEAHADIAALGLVPDVKTYLDSEAEKLAKQWLDKYRIPIKRLPDERQEAYRQIKSMSADPQDLDLVKPKSWMEATSVREADGTEHPLPVYKNHMLCGEEGAFPADLNTWEVDFLKAEMQREGFLAWYRNPSRSSQDSLGVAYNVDTQVLIVRPDFIFFSSQANGTMAADIVDPHGTQFSDAIPKLQGLARYAEQHAHVYRRIESVAKVGDKLRVLDLTSPEVRKGVCEASDAKTVFGSPIASDY
jgi:type III restriction enzyme